MQVSGNSIFVILQADDGYIFVEEESGAGMYTVCLGLNERLTVYKEIPVEEYFGPEVLEQTTMEEELANIFNEEVNK